VCAAQGIGGTGLSHGGEGFPKKNPPPRAGQYGGADRKKKNVLSQGKEERKEKGKNERKRRVSEGP